MVTQAYDDHHDQLHRYILSLTRDPQLAEDVVQECFARLWRAASAGQPPIETKAWLFRVGRNLVISGGRRRQVADRYFARLSLTVESNSTSSSEDHFIVRESGRELGAMLARLSTIDRTSLLMAAEGYSGAEIARAVGGSENAVRTRMCRARARLRSQLQALA